MSSEYEQLKEIVLALQIEVDALKSKVAALESAQACVTYDSGADVCTIGNVTSTNVIADDFVYVGTGENDLTTGNGIKISNAGDTELTLNTGNFVADVAQNIDLEAGTGGSGTAFMGTGPSDQTSGSGIRFVKGNGNALLTLNTGNFVADVAQDIDLEAGTGGGDGSKAFLGTGPIDQTSGSGIRFNKGNGNALLTLNTGNFVADVAQDIDLEAGTGGGLGSKAFLGTGPIDQTSGSGIRFNKGNGHAFLTTNNSGRVFIESGANGYLTGTCGAAQANVCLP